MKSRLFWKLFVAFWLANSLTFLVGAGMFVLNDLRGDTPALRSLLNNELQMLERFGSEAGVQMLTVWPEVHEAQVGLYDQDDNLLAGQSVAVPRFERRVTTADGQVRVLRSSAETDLQMQPRPRSSGPLVTGALMSALFSLLVTIYLVRPLNWLRQAMGQVAQGRFDVRVRPRLGRRRDEIVDLAADCDRMAGQLKDMVQAQQNLLHDISHELRSPLTRLHVAIGLLRQEPDQTSMLDRIEGESRRINALIGELLTLARAQSGGDRATREPFDVCDLLDLIVENAGFEAAAKQCRVRLIADDGFVTCADHELLHRAFENVIRNAVRYTREGTEVTVHAEVFEQGQRLEVTVSDQGPGVPPERLDSIFQPFDRGGKRGIGGFGLGLAIAQRAIEQHQGRIVAHAAPGGGLAVRIELPRED
ncbi:MAG: Sensor histidine kinase CpxA [Pseudomonas citronellolis]|nr:MAG: Sensor histidine kinase CpxA [Pseudomonas citronellolis]